MSNEERFEIVHTEAGWHARVRAANAEITWSTEVYTTYSAAVDAVVNLAELFSYDGRVWLDAHGITVAGDGSELGSKISVPVVAIDERQS
jgi:uncharacterized protein YegP (UPF0339 family)